MSIYNEYFTLDKTWKDKYGNTTFLLFQVGAFFEVYGTKNNTENIDTFSQITNLKIAQKSNTLFHNDPVLMAGFRDYQLEYYIEKLTENGYTAVVFVQEDKEEGQKGKNRVFDSVYSPGTFFSCQESTETKVSNNILCFWAMEKKQREKTAVKTFICGIAVVDILTGKSSIVEYEMEEFNFDELERILDVYAPNEILCIDQKLSTVDQKLSTVDQKLSTVDQPSMFLSYLNKKQVSLVPVDMSSEKIKNVMKQTYIEEILNQQFGINTYQNCFEFNTYRLATMAFCYLLDFIYEHNRNLVKNIGIPVFNNEHERMILANHTLKQLNLLDDGNGKGKLSSVLSFLNNCKCPVGKRRFRDQLLNPVYNEEWLKREYDVVSEMLNPDNEPLIPVIRKMLGTIPDIEKISRQLAINKIYPRSLFQFYESLKTIQQMDVCLMESGSIRLYLFDSRAKEFQPLLKELMDFILSHLVINESTEDDELQSVLKEGVSTELDKLTNEFLLLKERYEQWREALNYLQGEQYVKIHKTEKSGISLYITKNRCKILKEALPKQIKIGNDLVNTSTLEFISVNTTTNEISSKELSKLSKRMLELREEIQRVGEQEYKAFVERLDTQWHGFIQIIAHYVGKLDVLTCRAYNAKEYHYCCPTLSTSNDERSYVNVKNMRHVLIEHLITQETYCPNDLELSNDPQGMMLFGINSSGKTSLLRSLGVSLILAQSGNFVPATSFEYKPYRSIYSRIIGNDNLFKGHSSFAVEMTELRVILKMANQYSMVLADEISKGSEMDSAMSITTAALLNFVKLKCNFIITSHLHEIVKFDEIQEMSKNRQITLKHLSVVYNAEKDVLVYDRKLKDGSGESFYGLLVCKSLHLPAEFIETAYQIRNKYLNDCPTVLSQKTSVYNSKKIRGMCEMCGREPSKEVHHILPQKNADERGFFDNGIHKNHIGNLSALCEKCHDNIHGNDKKLNINTKQI